MAIYDHKYGELSYLRIYRSWGGIEHQEYVRVKDDREAAMKAAREIDARFQREQQAYIREKANLPDYHIRSDGSIRGLRRITVSRKGRTPAEVFELRINVPWEDSVKRTTISIAVHGEEKGFKLAIDKIAEWYGIEKDAEAYSAMLGKASHYTSGTSLSDVADIALQKAKSEFEQLKGGLLKGFKRFSGQA